MNKDIDSLIKAYPGKIRKKVIVYIENQLNKVCLYFIPMLNPDGVMLTQTGLNSVKDQKMKRQLLKLNKGSYDFTEWKAN